MTQLQGKMISDYGCLQSHTTQYAIIFLIFSSDEDCQYVWSAHMMVFLFVVACLYPIKMSCKLHVSQSYCKELIGDLFIYYLLMLYGKGQRSASNLCLQPNSYTITHLQGDI